MAKAKIKVKSGKSGTKIAKGKIRVAPTDTTRKKPVFQTRAQLNVHILDKNGKPRATSR